MNSDYESIQDISQAIHRGSLSCVEIVRDCVKQIENANPSLGAFREIYKEDALARARSIDERITKGEKVGTLAGIPIAIKDNIVTNFGTTTCGSRYLENYHSPFTATAVQRFLDQDAIVIGKTNCDEFAMGSSTEHCAFGATRNPWDKERVPGGSSGGSAVAVAARLCPAALGSDTGGSIRQPAALCGIVGLKPSYGRVSRFGLVAFGSSLDQIGPLTTNVADAALLLETIAGGDVHDSTCAQKAVPNYLHSLEKPIEKLKLGVSRQVLAGENDPGVNRAIEETIGLYKGLGAEICEVDLSLTDYGIATYYIIATAEASSNLARYDGIRYGKRVEIDSNEDLFDLYAKSRTQGLGAEVQRRIMLGTYVLSAGYYDAHYKRALQVRRLIRQEYDRAFEQCDAIIGPTSPTPAFRMGEKQDPLAMYLSDVYTVNANIAGICAISIPCGFAEVDGRSLPVGLQLQCRAFDEETLFRVARIYERETQFHVKKPELQFA